MRILAFRKRLNKINKMKGMHCVIYDIRVIIGKACNDLPIIKESI